MKHSASIILSLFVVVATTTGAHAPPDEVALPGSKVTTATILDSLTVREKVGQLIMPWLIGSYAPLEGDAFDNAAKWIEDFGVGGIIISIGSPLDAAAKLNALQRRSKLPLIVAADLEYGAAMRMIGATAFPPPMAFGATGRELDAYQLGRITAIEARAVGIHWTFSPVADINSNPDNPIINTRSFGESPEQIVPLLTAYIQGASDHGLYTTAKHFPGHGDTGTDSHISLPVLDACWERLDTLELVPFQAAIDAGVTSVMTAHIAMTCLDNGHSMPATLSPQVMGPILRDSLGFEGIVVTDALAMGAIVNEYGAGESAVQAFLAGSDLLLMPDDIGQAFDAMVEAVESGRIPMERLDRSVNRLMDLKQQAGLFAKREVDLDSIPAIVGRRSHQDVADEMARRSLTLVQRGPIDEMRSTRKRTALIVYGTESNLSIGSRLTAELRALGEGVQSFRLYPASGRASYDSAQSVINRNSRVIIAASVRPVAGRGHLDLPEAMARLITRTDRRKPTILVSFGSPYLLSQLRGFRGSYLLAWQTVPAAERAVAAALAGGAPIQGVLPITLSDQFPRSHSVQVPQQ